MGVLSKQLRQKSAAEIVQTKDGTQSQQQARTFNEHGHRRDPRVADIQTDTRLSIITGVSASQPGHTAVEDWQRRRSEFRPLRSHNVA